MSFKEKVNIMNKKEKSLIKTYQKDTVKIAKMGTHHSDDELTAVNDVAKQKEHFLNFLKSENTRFMKFFTKHMKIKKKLKTLGFGQLLIILA